jgi:hypothetical protein
MRMRRGRQTKQRSHSLHSRPDYPSRFVSGLTLKLQLRFPQREHRIRFTTSASNASHPASAASVPG